jgi:hypothetical protein
MKTSQQIESEYRTFITDTGGRCWRCGRSAKERPPFWNAPFGIERAHIDGCNHPRRRDRRCIWSACSLCHQIQHGFNFPGHSCIPLTVPELLAIKKFADPEYWDRAFLQTCSIRRLPKSATLHRVETVSHVIQNLVTEEAQGIIDA